MRRREAQLAREEDRELYQLKESDYLLGVHDSNRMGGLRFRENEQGPFLHENRMMAAPPWTSLRELEYASLQLEKENSETQKDYMKWLKLLIAPGGSLGGARPKASVVDEDGNLWIAKFPSQNDDLDMGSWEHLAYELALAAKIQTSHSERRRFSGSYHTFLTKRFDRNQKGERIHFASAMTLLKKSDGDDASSGVSYLELAEFLNKNGANTDQDLEQLWRRIVFYICISNTDDHLRNHGFLLTPKGWVLSPAFDMNPSETGEGLKLNISLDDNVQDLELAKEVAPYFRVKPLRAKEILGEVMSAVKGWRGRAKKMGISASEQERMQNAFRLVNTV
jgi:serine/threonine-protein kinase HipA